MANDFDIWLPPYIMGEEDMSDEEVQLTLMERVDKLENLVAALMIALGIKEEQEKKDVT